MSTTSRTILFPERYELVICIDNRRQYVLKKKDMAQGNTNETQIMWNGVLGDLAIHFLAVPELTDLRIFPRLVQRNVTFEIGVELTLDSRRLYATTAFTFQKGHRIHRTGVRSRKPLRTLWRTAYVI